jgi:hypothetical protein
MRDIASVYTASTKRRLIIGCISALVAIPLVGCCLVLIGTVLFPALDKLAASGNQNTSVYIIVGIGLAALVGLLAIALVAFLVVTLRRAHALDAVFTPLGLTGSAYMLNGRHYQGQIAGRAVDVYIYRGPTVEIRLQAAAHTRLLAVPKGSLPTSVAWIFDKQPIATDNPSLNAFSIFPLDRAWAGKLLAEARAGDAIQTLMTLGADWAIFRRVEIQPGEVTLTLYRSRRAFGDSIDIHTVQVWLNALQSLAQAAESQPAPEVTGQSENVSSRQARQKRSTFLVYAVIAIVFVMPVCFIAVGGIAYLAVTLLR